MNTLHSDTALRIRAQSSFSGRVRLLGPCSREARDLSNHGGYAVLPEVLLGRLLVKDGFVAF